MKILVVDLETTGFIAKIDAIVEIGIALVDTETKNIELVFDHVVKDKKFNYNRHKNSWIFKNTTLTPEDVIEAKSLDYYFDEIQDLFDKYKMTAYNKSFDVNFLKAVGFKVNDIKCLMKTATQYSTYKDKNGKIKKPSVVEIYNQFFMSDGNVYVEEHRAGSDAKDEAKILLHMAEIKGSKALTVEKKDVTSKQDKDSTAKIFRPKYKEIGANDILPFGRYKGKVFSDVVKKYPKYIDWCLENVDGFKLTTDASKLIKDKKIAKKIGNDKKD